MKKLLYTIALAGGVTFLPAAQGMEVSEEENQIIERTQARIAQIRHEQKAKKERLEAELCSFDCQKAVDAIEEKRTELGKLMKAIYAAGVYGTPTMTLQQFKDTHPEYIQFEREYHLVPSDSNKNLSFAVAVLINAGVNKRTQDKELTEDEMNVLFSKARDLYMHASGIDQAAKCSVPHCRDWV